MAAPIVRSATASDVEPILDLLAHYGQPRSHFEPWYYHDPTYRPWHSFVLERDGELLCHARLFVRTMRLAGRGLPIAGIGNVITATHARGHGYSHQVVDAALHAAQSAGYAYSLLWTHIPRLYSSHGFTTVQEVHSVVRLPGVVQLLRGQTGFDIRAATSNDLPALVAADERFNASRTGPIQMNESLWCASRQCTGARTLVHSASRADAAAIDSYLRYRRHDTHVEVLDLGVDPGNEDLARALLVACLAERAPVPLHLTLPDSLQPAIRPYRPTIRRVHELMARPLALQTLAAVLGRLLPNRLSASGSREAVLVVDDHGGAYTIEITPETLTLHRRQGQPRHYVRHLTSAELTSLLLLGHRGDDALLAALFPPQDFVVWPSGRF